MIHEQTTKRNAYHNLRRKEKTISVGDRVLLKNHNKQNKLDLHWLGPYTVKSVKDNKCILKTGNYEVKSNINHIIKLADM